jgi:hypothetical protein
MKTPLFSNTTSPRHNIRGRIPASRRHGPQIILTAALAGAFVGLAPDSQAAVTLGPAASFSADGETYNLELRQDGDIASGEFGVEVEGQFSVVVSTRMDADPTIGFTVTVTDFGAPSSFIFNFFTPIVPTGPSVLVDSSLVGTVTDARGDGVSLTPFFSTILSGELNAATNMGVDVGPAFSAPATDPLAPGSIYAYGLYEVGPIPGPSAVWTEMAARAAFTLTGDNDMVTLTGFLQVVDAPAAVPESGPGWFGVLSLGLVALAGGISSTRRLVR